MSPGKKIATKVLGHFMSLLIICSCSNGKIAQENSYQVLIGDIDRTPYNGDVYRREYTFDGTILINSLGLTLNMSNNYYKDIGHYGIACEGNYTNSITNGHARISLVCSSDISGFAEIDFLKDNTVSGKGNFKLTDGSDGNIWFGKAITEHSSTMSSAINH